MRKKRGLLVGFTATAAVLGAAVAFGASGPAGSTTLYKWVDADGVTHYSDQPAPGSKEIHVLGAQSYKSTAATPSSRSSAKPTTVQYTRLEITRPTEGETVFNPAGGHVEAAAAVEPPLAPGHQLWFVLDGTRLPDPAGPNLSMTLTVERGSHTVATLVTDPSGREVLGSAPLQFFIRAPSILTGPQGPALTHKKP